MTEASGIPSYGTAFNDIGGGVFATLIDPFGVRIWFFPRNDIPADITANSPNPPGRAMNAPGANSTWPTPNARFEGPGNDFGTHFKDMQIVINTAFCGDWAGKSWNENETCKNLAPTCEEYVSANSGAFEEVYWAIRGIQVWEPVWENWTVPYPNGAGVNKEAEKTSFGGVAGPVRKRDL